MTQELSEYEIHTFLVRLWRDEKDDRGYSWRGEVRSALSGERRSFHDVALLEALLLAFVEEHGGLPSSPSGTAAQGPAEE